MIIRHQKRVKTNITVLGVLEDSHNSFSVIVLVFQKQFLLLVPLPLETLKCLFVWKKSYTEFTHIYYQHVIKITQLKKKKTRPGL